MTLTLPPEVQACQLLLAGQVQGVGFRPFIYQIAQQNHLCGWVRNQLGTVAIHVQGQHPDLQQFIAAIFSQKPPLAQPQCVTWQAVLPENFTDFRILASEANSDSDIRVPVDLFLCEACLTELNNPADRRHRYPFINCTQCGPRYTLIERLPYDRANTSMASFPLCPDCAAEYQNPHDRRFHAEPIACPVCGPHLSWVHKGKVIENNELALSHAVAALRQGQILAVKGIGGYHLLCDANNDTSIQRLRQRKPRPSKPLAVLFPAPPHSPCQVVEKFVILTEADRAFLSQAARPILLLPQRDGVRLSAQIAPRLREIGVFLPYSPLHHLLLNAFAAPVVATSANLSGEPVLTDNCAVEQRLSAVADGFLHHNRPIVRPADDAVYRPIAGQARPLRLGRGISPLELTLPYRLPQPVLALGSQMKNTVTLAWDKRAVVSPHIGDMDNPRSLAVFHQTIHDLQALYRVKALHLLCDAHPHYRSHRWARQQPLPVTTVLHHHAHAAAAYYEAQTTGKVIAFTWDAVGLGDDGRLWGGETFIGQPHRWERVASMRPFHLIGGDRVGREPWRSAAALCWELGLNCPVSPHDVVHLAWQRRLNTVTSTSVARLFDAASALLGLGQTADFEGKAPMLLESHSQPCANALDVPVRPNAAGLWQADWSVLLPLLLDSRQSVAERASLFHHSMAKLLLNQAKILRQQHNIQEVTLSGGVFQNRLLSETAVALLQQAGFRVTLPAQIPCNDAGISFGQVMVYAARFFGD